MVAQARGGQAPLHLRSFTVPEASFLFPSSERSGTQTKALTEEKRDSSESDSSASDDSSSSQISNILPLENSSFILNCFTKVAHVAKFNNMNPHPTPACGRDLGLAVELLQVVDSVPSDYDLCQRKACSMDK